MNPLLFNAVDSLKVGMEFSLRRGTDTSNKHAILTIFHSIELLLKEYLYRVNPILIYRNIDKAINDDSITVGINEIIARLDNLKIGLPKEEQDIIKKIQKRRNRIEHHKYEKDGNDQFIIGESLKFVQYFLESKLDEKLHSHIDRGLLDEIEKAIYNYRELEAIAHSRLDHFLKKIFPDWDRELEDIPREFPGTLDCPVCNNSFLVVDFITTPFCFHCNKQVVAKECDNCGFLHLKSEECPYCLNFEEDEP